VVDPEERTVWLIGIAAAALVVVCLLGALASVVLG
jgi:hypothetical protein